MAEILTTDFKSDTTRLFIEDIKNNDYYIFVSGIERMDSENSRFSKNEFLENTLFGKKIYADDCHFMIKYFPWQREDVFTQYDDAVDLEEEKFYAVVGPTNNDTGDYRIYKCLFNNDGAQVQSPPSYNANTENQIYQTADGYLWKYIYNLTEIEFDAYNSLGYIPLRGDFEVNPTANNGGSEISDIFVNNPGENIGYTKVTGTLFGSPTSGGVIIGEPDVDDEISQVFFYYYGQTIYITNNNNAVSNLYDIEYYNYDTATGRVEFRVNGNPVADGVSSNAKFQILPKIKLDGDGTGASAVPVMNQDGRITSAILLNRGSGYNNVVARVVDPLYDFNPADPSKTDERADLRAILSPVDGHGFNLIDEFHCRHFGLYAYITGEDNLLIGANNTYSSVGVVRNPEFKDANNVPITGANTPAIFDNRIKVTSDQYNFVEVNSVVNQFNSDQEITFEGVVHEIDPSSNTFWIAEYMGPYVNSANSTNSFDTNKVIRNTTGQILRINTPIDDNIVFPTYQQRSGRVYFLEDFFALPRTENSREEFKFVMEF